MAFLLSENFSPPAKCGSKDVKNRFHILYTYKSNNRLEAINNRGSYSTIYILSLAQMARSVSNRYTVRYDKINRF
jgi:hypothetical protein